MHESWRDVQGRAGNVARALKTIKIWTLSHRQWGAIESFGVEECLIPNYTINQLLCNRAKDGLEGKTLEAKTPNLMATSKA